MFDLVRVWRILALDRAEPYGHRGGLTTGLGTGRLASAASGEPDRARRDDCGGELKLRFHRGLLW